MASPGLACALLLGSFAAMAGLFGWLAHKAEDIKGDVARTAEDIKGDIEKEWQRTEHSPAIQKVAGHARDAIKKVEEASKAGAAAAETKAKEVMQGEIQKLHAAWQADLKPVESYVIPPKCLLAMAVGAGAVTASSGLALASLGFASEGVEADSLAALWQSALGDVKAGSLFARLQSLGAAGLSTAQKFEVFGALATASACFCGIINDLCQHCMPSAHQTRREAGGNVSMAIIIQGRYANQSYQMITV